MRIRRKKWARPELAACPFCIQTPTDFKNRWKDAFRTPNNPLYVELGCGKGSFVGNAALLRPDINFLAIDIKPDMLGVAKRKIELLFRENERLVSNLRLCVHNIEWIDTIIGSDDCVSRLYINFCNPWPKARHKKHRLTHTRQLLKYRDFLQGELWFKTDDDELFDETLEYLREAGYALKYITRDLHSSDFDDNIMTEHEQQFIEAGKLIKFLIAEPKDEPIVVPE